MFDNGNVPSIHLAIQLQVFLSVMQRGGTNHFVYLPILIHSWCSWARLKATDYSF